VVDEEDRIAHVLATPLNGDAVEGSVDWVRRYDHMQQHTGQHLLSAVFEELFGMPTVSFHMGAETSTIELGATALTTEQAERVEERCAAIAADARPVSIAYEDAASVAGLRKESQRSGMLRVVSIEGLDRSACGGTHVRSTAETGPIFLRKVEKIRGNVRVEFVCGARALRQARADFRALSAIARTLSAPLERTPDLVTVQTERVKSLEKTAQRLAVELAAREGRELHAATEPDAGGLRRVVQRGAIDEAMRTRAQAFVAQGRAAFWAISNEPPSVLLAASNDSGINAGARVKSAVTAAGGRGGGNVAIAQGSVPSADVLSQIEAELLA
jgi:alanyl-tRNA synthetase